MKKFLVSVALIVGITVTILGSLLITGVLIWDNHHVVDGELNIMKGVKISSKYTKFSVFIGREQHVIDDMLLSEN